MTWWRVLNRHRWPAVGETRTLRQLQETECGAIALAIVLDYYGTRPPLPEVRRRCQVTRDGVSALALVRAANDYDLTAKAVRLVPSALAQLTAPSILVWNANHYVVLEQLGQESATINDPATGRRQLTASEFESQYSGVAIILAPGPNVVARPETDDELSDVRQLLALGGKWLFLLTIIVILEAVLLAIAILALGDMAIAANDGGHVTWIRIGILLVGLLAIRMLHVIISDQAIVVAARSRMQRYLHELQSVPIAFLELRQPDELAGRLRITEIPGILSVRIVTEGMMFAIQVPILLVLVGNHSGLATIIIGAGFLVASGINLFILRGRSDEFQRQETEFREYAALTSLYHDGRRAIANGEWPALLGKTLSVPGGASRSASDEPRRAVHDAICSGAMVFLIFAMLAFAATAPLGPDAFVVVGLSSWFIGRRIWGLAALAESITLARESMERLDDSAEELDFATSERVTSELVAR